MTAVNPFPGPQPYRSEDRRFFFGRTDEIEELTSLVLSSSATLLYAPSGAGKSSLLQAGVAPYLQQSFGFVVLPTVHLGTGGRVAAADAAPDHFSAAVCEAIADPDADCSGIAAAAASRRPDGSSQVLLVLDQFEEVFNDPALWRQRDQFFAELTTALRENTWLRVIVALRSDYLADLVPYERDLPGHLVVRYRLGRLDERHAAEAIREAFTASGVALTEQDLGTVLDVLLDEDQAGRAGRRVRAQHVNTIQLQIVCRQLWEQLRQRDGSATAPVLTADAVVGLRNSVVRFVDEAIDAAVDRSRGEEAAVRWWLGQRLITSSGRRAFVLVEEERTAGLPNAVVDALAEVKLLQFEQRHGSRLVELTHDSMTEGVRASNEAWLGARHRTRRRLSAVLFVLLLALLATFPLLRNPGVDAVAESQGVLTDQPVRVPFSGVAGAVLVDVTFDAIPAGTVTLRVAEVEEGTAGRTVARHQIDAETDDRWTITVAARTELNEPYAVHLSAGANERLPYRLTVTQLPDVLTGEVTTGVSSGQVAVPLEPGSRHLLSVEDGDLVYAQGAEILVAGYENEWVVVEASQHRSLVVLDLEDTQTTDPPAAATVRRALLPAATEVTVDGLASLTFDHVALVTFTVGDVQAPVAAEVICDRPVQLSRLDPGNPTPIADQPVMGGRGARLLPLTTGPGDHELLVSASPGEDPRVSCTAAVRAFDVPAVNAFGPRTFTFPPGGTSAGLRIDPPTDATLTAALPDTLQASLLCVPADAGVLSSTTGRMLAFVPRDGRCTLWFSRTDAAGAAPSEIELWVAQVSAGEGG